MSTGPTQDCGPRKGLGGVLAARRKQVENISRPSTVPGPPFMDSLGAALSLVRCSACTGHHPSHPEGRPTCPHPEIKELCGGDAEAAAQGAEGQVR